MKLWAVKKYDKLNILPKNISGLVIDGDFLKLIDLNILKVEDYNNENNVLMVGEIWSGYWQRKFGRVRKYYIDESIVNGRYKEHNLLHDNPSIVFGEPDKDFLLQYKKNTCQVTYTAYREYIKIFGIRIPLFWTNQIKTWEWLEKEFGNRFKVCWINIDMNKKDYDKLISWANTHSKDIWLYVEPEVTVNNLINQIHNL